MRRLNSFARYFFAPAEHGNKVDRAVLSLSAFILVFVLPVLMVFSSRSSAALLVIATILICFVEYRSTHKQGSILSGLHWRYLIGRDYTFFALWILFALLALISIVFTQDASFHLRRLVEFLLPVFAGGALIAILHKRRLPITTSLMAFGLTLAALIALLEFHYGAPLRHVFGLPQEPFRMNRTMVTFVLLAFPLLALALYEGRIWLALAALPLPALAVYGSESGAAAFGALIGLFAYAFARLLPKLAHLAFVITAAFIWLSAPWHGTLLARIIPPRVHEKLASTSSAVRVEIYRAFGEVVEASPWFGAGFNTAATPKNEPYYTNVSPALQEYIGFGHPHNAALQLWAELGFVGVLIALALTWGALRLITQVPRAMQPLWYGFFATCFAISMVSHGAWQAWWAANIAICLGLMTMALHVSQKETPQ